MDGADPMSLRIAITAGGEILPLFQSAAERRPYQPYCVTEASSRCQSPDATSREPLRISYLAATGVANEAQHERLAEIELGRGLVQSAASNHERCSSLTVTPQTGSNSQKRYISSNSFSPPGNTSLADTSPITQAVTPRGSHSLASNRRTMCDDTLSHPRMRQSVSLYIAASRQSIRKSVPWYNNYARMDHRHPLPSVPEKATPISKDGEKEDETYDGEYYPDYSVYELAQTKPSILSESKDKSEEFLSNQHGDVDAQLSPVSTLDHNDHEQTPSCDGSIRDEPEYLNSETPFSIASSRGLSNSPQSSDVDAEHAQLPSLCELYLSRKQLLERTEDQTALRRTKPRDTNLKFQSGQSLSRPLDPQKILPAHNKTHQDPDQHDLPSSSSQKPFSSCSTATKRGPRPPPWGSYDTLAMQRQQRNKARERRQLCTYRQHRDSTITSVYKDSESSDIYRKGVVRREVDEYRRQVLSVYPELELDKGVRFDGRRCCCVVM